MSVINQMLRDLDQRGKAIDSAPGSTVLSTGTQSVEFVPSAQQQPAKTRTGWWVALAVVATAAGVAAAWQAGVPLRPQFVMDWVGAKKPQIPPQSAVATAAAPAGAASLPQASVPMQPAQQASSPALPASATVAAAVLALDRPMSLRVEPWMDGSVAGTEPVSNTQPTAVTTAKPAAKPAPAPVSVPKDANRPTAVLQTPVKVEAKPTVAAPAPAGDRIPAPDTAALAQRQASGMRDALVQAQGLWSTGNQAGAIDVLQEAIQVAENLAAPAGTESAFAAVVRELARMQLAIGRVAEAHELLVRHEGRLKGLAEIWAMRGNAAQRLGQHQDSVLSYMHALQVRPTEQRWLLGLAVSLAAMGQTASASEVVERARVEGPINRDIAAYLRQMGVNIK